MWSRSGLSRKCLQRPVIRWGQRNEAIILEIWEERLAERAKKANGRCRIGCCGLAPLARPPSRSLSGAGLVRCDEAALGRIAEVARGFPVSDHLRRGYF